MTDNKKTLIGVAWPYVNGELHPGHIIGCYLPADIFARFKRLQGNEVVMVSGTDDHGTPITIQADKEETTPQEIVEKYGPRIRKLLLETYKVSFDSFTGTNSDIHKEITQEFFRNLANEGKIIKKTTEQYFSEADNKFLPDRYVEGECSYCHAKEQRGDQCENCGRSLQVGELINPYAKLTKNPVSLKETEHYFVDLKAFEPELRKYLDENKDKWRSWVWKEANGWLEEGLEPRAITRDIDWGIEIPQGGIPEELLIDGAESKRFYVWFDAVIGYFSEGIKLAQSKDVFREDFVKLFWDGNDESLEHFLFVGKDNLFFHTLWWQSLLIGQNKNYKLADNVPVNHFLNLEGKKFSKSRNVYIDATKLVEVFGLDAVRFYLASIMPESSDANWVWKDFQQTVNAELNGNLGNFIHRTLTFYKTKIEGTNIQSDSKALDSEIEQEINSTFTEVNEHLNNAEFVAALNRILKLSQSGNKFFNDQEPWKSLKENPAECVKTIYNCLQIINALRILIYPFMPDASDRLSETLGLEKVNPENGINKYNFEELKIENLQLKQEFTPLFSKIENEQIESFNQATAP